MSPSKFIAALALLFFYVHAQQESSTNDVAIDEDCKRAIDHVCKEGRVVDCLTYRYAQEQEGKIEGEKFIIGACRKTLLDYWIQVGSSFEKNTQLQEKCEEDADRLGCLNETLIDEQGEIITCLRQHKYLVSTDCAEEITLFQMAATWDYRVDPLIKKVCAEDVKNFCDGVEPGEGEVQKCLREKINVIDQDCREELELQEIEDSDDIRLNTTLYRACLVEKEKHCGGLSAGDGRVISCLIDNRQKTGFGRQCDDELAELMYKRIQNNAMDSELKKVCKVDMLEMCSKYKDLQNYLFQDQCLNKQNKKKCVLNDKNMQKNMLQCLQFRRAYLKEEKCAEYIHKVMAQQFSDIRLNIPLAESCVDERNKFCSDIPPGQGKVITCLQNNSNQLAWNNSCKITLFHQEVIMAEDIDFKYPMKLACKYEIQKFCKNLPRGKARIIRCLQENMDEPGFEKKCHEEVAKDLARSFSHPILNYHLYNACQHYGKALCLKGAFARVFYCHNNPFYDAERVSFKCAYNLCIRDFYDTNTYVAPFMEDCGYHILDCLINHIDEIQQQECSNEVLYLIKMDTKYQGDAGIKEYTGTFPLYQYLFTSLLFYFWILRTIFQVLLQYRQQQKRQYVQQLFFVFTVSYQFFGSPYGCSSLWLGELICYQGDAMQLATRCQVDLKKDCYYRKGDVDKIQKCLQKKCKQFEMKLMYLQSLDVRLQPTLMKACQLEMDTYCQEISHGNGHMLRCLQINVGLPDFSAKCALEVQTSGELMQIDDSLDYILNNKCESDVRSYYKKDKKGDNVAAVFSCLVDNYNNLTDVCKREISREVGVAFWKYNFDASITKVCDADVNTTCTGLMGSKKEEVFRMGFVGQCLFKQLAEDKPFKEKGCKKLAKITDPEDMAEMLIPIKKEKYSIKIVEILQVLDQKLGGNGTLVQNKWVLIGTVVVVLAAVIAFIAMGIRNVFSRTIVLKPGQISGGAV